MDWQNWVLKVAGINFGSTLQEAKALCTLLTLCNTNANTTFSNLQDELIKKYPFKK